MTCLHPTPKPKHRSCIVQKLSSLVRLTEDEAHLLEALEQDALTVAAGSQVTSMEADFPPLMVVKSGWLISERTDPDGHRRIVRTHHPGDIIGFADLSYRSTPCQTYAKSNASVCPFTRDSLKTLLSKSPRISALLLAISLIERSMQDDRALVTGRNHASGKLALFILQTLEKLQLVNHHSADRFFCPMTQTDIGDLVGMTSVHVSRTFKKLEEADCVSRNKSFIHVLDERQLEHISGYRSRLNAHEFSWVPASGMVDQH